MPQIRPARLNIKIAVATCCVCLLLIYYRQEVLVIFKTTKQDSDHEKARDVPSQVHIPAQVQSSLHHDNVKITPAQATHASAGSSSHHGNGIAAPASPSHVGNSPAAPAPVPTTKDLLAALRANGPVDLPSKEVLKSMSLDSLNKIYHSHLDNTGIVCHRKLRMGKIGDGGWEICDDEKYRPGNPCLVYSYGIAFDFSFDEDVTRLYQCQVFSFDPSMGVATYQRTPLNKFVQAGISGTNTVNSKKWKLQTFSQAKKDLGHSGKLLDVLKMDVEWSEWQALPEMIQSGELRHVKQLLIEYHAGDVVYSHLGTLKDLYDIGFRIFYTHKNPVCGRGFKFYPIVRTLCYEVHYVNINYSPN